MVSYIHDQIFLLMVLLTYSVYFHFNSILKFITTRHPSIFIHGMLIFGYIFPYSHPIENFLLVFGYSFIDTILDAFYLFNQPA